MAEQVKALYSIAQKDVYSVMLTAWGNYAEHQVDFKTLNFELEMQ